MLIFTMLKELFEDVFRMISDAKINNTKAMVLNRQNKAFEQVCWKDIRLGDVIRVSKDETFPCDMLFVYARNDIIFVDTMNLDGETNLKPKSLLSKELYEFVKEDLESVVHDGALADDQDRPAPNINKYVDKLVRLEGVIESELPCENLESWDANVEISAPELGNDAKTHASINSLLLRGCYLRNVDYCYGIAVYLGNKTKIMMNAKKPRRKVSNLMKMMNYMLYTVFGLQFFIISLFATLSCIWIANKGSKYDYLDLSSNVGFGKWIIQLLTYWVAYSHMIPISLYVMIEVLKLTQSSLIKWDVQIGKENSEFKPAECKNSDLIEELGQVDFIFSDKTGTLTRNEMVFKKCSVEGRIYTDVVSQLEKSENLSHSASEFKGNENSNEEETWIHAGNNGNKAVYNFFKHMTICHSVMVDKDSAKAKKADSAKSDTDNDPKNSKESEETKVIYQCSSPDEIALVEAADKVGLKLVDRTKEYVVVEEKETEIKYRMHKEFKFDSKRKRMSVIVEENDSYFIYTKGADNEMIKKIQWRSPQEKDVLESHLEKFARLGLRTLVMGVRSLDEAEFSQIINEMNKIDSSSDPNKDARMEELYERYESDLEFVGASAIEDLLQEEVPETIANLMNANIRVWVLTGDKQETAIEIAKSCKLIQEDMKEIILSIKPENTEHLKGLPLEEANRKRQVIDEDNRNKIKQRLEQEIDTHLAKNELAHTPTEVFKKPLKDLVLQYPITIVVDGITLALILGDDELEQLFLTLGLYSKSVVCCRVTPKQKSVVVGLASKYKKGCIRLSIGDGANDVPMIMEANIGVGIRGKEGTQAVRSADYAISQFKYLEKLVLFHGRLGYRRVSWMVCYYFYKNIVLVFTEIYFAFYNGFSGQIYFADWLPMLYNSLWTSLTCLFAYALERDVTFEITKANPRLYEAGQKKEYFSFMIFWKWVALSLFHGVVIYFGCSYGFRGVIDSSGKTEDLWFASTIAFSCIIHLVTYKLAIELLFFNWIVIAAGLGSVVFYWLFVIVFNTSAISQVFQPELEYVYFRMFSTGKFWIVLFCLPFIALIPDITIKYFKQLYFPCESDNVIRESKKKGLLK